MSFSPPPALISSKGLCAGPIINGLGDSLTSINMEFPGATTGSYGSSATNAQYAGTAFLSWAQAFSRGRLNFDLTLGYPGNQNGLYKVLVLAGGSGYAVSDTVTVNAVSGGTGPAALLSQLTPRSAPALLCRAWSAVRERGAFMAIPAGKFWPALAMW